MKYAQDTLDKYKCRIVRNEYTRAYILPYCLGVAHTNDIEYCTCSNESAIEHIRQEEESNLQMLKEDITETIKSWKKGT